ncbi:tRNA lysidine(34) synthetase TilS [Pelagibacteraceae bacterium]|nr:tRNA lysidine(34) synthetase TilS [Pelagibacteraceae bacterium]
MSKKDLSVLNLKKSNLNNKTFLIYSNFKSYLEKCVKKKNCLVAVSGGPDSLALAVLSKIYSEEKKNRVFFVLIDHGIRPNSSKEAKDVKTLFKKKKINLTILKNRKKIDNNIQSQARDVRYKLLLDFCNKNKIKFILTGHHREDQIETFLIRLSRGSGIQGLSSMKKISSLNTKTKLIRPLLDEKKQYLAVLAKQYFGKFFKDSSNTNQKYLRTKIRGLIKHFEKSGIKHDRIINSINNLGATRDTLNAYILRVEKNCITKKKEKIVISLKNLSIENEEIQLKIISNCITSISKNYYPPRAKKVLNLLNGIKSDKKIKSTLGGCVIHKIQNNLVIYKEEFKKSLLI